MTTIDETIDDSRAYRLHELVAVRPEPFGALVYHYGNRKLVFLKNRTMVDVVNSLNDHATLGDALTANNVADSSRAKYLAAFSSLLRSDMLVERVLSGVA